MASGALLDFVPARRPEAVRMDVSQYKIIKPKNPSRTSLNPDQEESGDNDDSVDSDEQSSVYEDDYENDSDDSGESEEGSSDSMEDSEKSDTDDSSSESEETNPSMDPNQKQEEERSSIYEESPTRNKTKELSKDAHFYDINENQNDRGTRSPRRIHKSWHPSARAPVGLINRGVTCYMNAAVQAILHLPAIGRYLLEVLNGSHPKVNKGSVTHELASLFKKSMEKKSPVLPLKLLRRLEDINPMLDEWQQEDSHEYYMSLLSRLQEDSVPRGEKLRSSIIHDIFGGSVEQKVTCKRCESVSTTTQDFYDLPVSFSQHESNNHYTLERSIRDFFTPEVITATEKGSGYQCEKCKKRTKAVKQIAISEAPEYLTVHIKRFKMDGNVSKKVKDTLKYSLDMNLTQYETDQKQQLRYKLIAVIVHEGRTVSSGHYIALTRQPNNAWMMYDDDMTRPIPETYVESHPSAYILLYSRLLEKPGKSGDKAADTNATHPSSSTKSPNPTSSASPVTPSSLKSSSAKKQTKKAAKRALASSGKGAAVPGEHDRIEKLKSNYKLKPKQSTKSKLKSSSKTPQLKQKSKQQNTIKSVKNGNADGHKRRMSADTIDEIFGKGKKRKTLNH